MSEAPTTTVDLKWEGGLRFAATDAYGHSITIEAPEADGGDFDCFKPGEMLLTSLAGCSGIDVVGILRKQRQDVTAIEIKVSGVQEPDPPWTWTGVHVEYVLHGQDLDAHRVERAIHLSETKYCSVGATVAGRCKVTSEFRIVQDKR